MKTLRIGVIGVGGRGALAAQAHQPDQQSRLVAGADVNLEALKRFAEQYGPDVFTTTDYRTLLKRKDVDVVFITSPDFLHEEQSVAALKAGKAVYLEKPMAITLKGCDRILRTAYETGSKLYLGHNMRHFPVVLKMKEVIEAGTIGQVQAAWCRHFISYGGDAYFKDWHSERRLSTGLLLQKAAHDIDVMHWLTGGYTTSVVGMGKLSVYNRCERRKPTTRGVAAFNSENWPPLEVKGFSPQIDVEDHSMILMQLDNGVQCSYMQCHYTPDSVRNYTVIGTHGRLENIGDYGKCKVVVYTERDGGDPDIVYDLKPLSGSHGGADPRIVNEFLRFVRQGGKTNTSPIAARNSVAVGYLGTMSLRSGSGLKLVPPVDARLAAYFEKGQRR
jgi:predicted dehydrogenase